MYVALVLVMLDIYTWFHDDKHDNHTIVHGASSCASFARLRFRYLIFYCSFVMRMHTTGLNESWILSSFYILRVLPVFRWYYSEMLTMILKHRRSRFLSFWSRYWYLLWKRPILEKKITKLNIKNRLNLFTLINIFLCSQRRSISNICW